MAEEEPKLPTGPPGALKRPGYREGNYLAHVDLGLEQRYLLQRLRRHNRHLYGWGVVCGLNVVPANDARRPWEILVCPGYALGPYGDDIKVDCTVPVNVSDYLWLQPLDGAPRVFVVYVGIQYAEQLFDPVAVRLPACGCHEIKEFSRIRDGFRIDILWSLPPQPQSPLVDPCSPRVQSCPPCPEDPHIILASIQLPGSESDPITRDAINNFFCPRQL
jgi:hypothetical protein